MKLTLLNHSYHRNGISGAPFEVVIFRDQDGEASLKLAILFEASHHCAVLDIARLATGDIAFGSNSWRGDTFEPTLRQLIADRDRPLPQRFDAYEIHGVFEYKDENGIYCEQVDDKVAEFWSLYGHIPGQGIECIGNFDSREAAAEVYARITGRRYAAGKEA